MKIGGELCPVCNQPINPGACETCVHYFGTVSDGELIWSVRFEVFSAAWGDLADACETFWERNGRRPKPPVRKAYQAATFRVQSLDPCSISATQALFELLPLEHGPTIETEGMLSCSGHSVFLEDSEALQRIIDEIRTAQAEIVEVCVRASS